MTWSDFTSLSPRQALNRLDSNQSGLIPSQASARLSRYGPNQVRSHQVLWQQILIRQFTSPFIYLLVSAAVVSGLLESLLDAGIILLFVFLNAALGFLQEYRSDRTLKTLQKYLQSYSLVKRAGQLVRIVSPNLVPGDILVLKPGDILPADVRFLSLSGLVLDESALTGESAPVGKTSAALKIIGLDMYQAQNIGFAGTSVVKGRAEAVVVATGTDSSFGQITSLAQSSDQVSAFTTDLTRFSRFVLRLVIATLVILFVAILILKGGSISPVSLLVFSIALAVSVVPEALPIVMTFSLSRGASRLAKNQVLVKKLTAIEDLGSIQVLCTDKTGTLTENHLSLAGTFSISASSPSVLALAGAEFLANSTPPADPFDIALWNSLTPPDRHVVEAFTPLAALPFDSDRRQASVLVRSGRHHLVVLRGAPEAVLPLCSHLPSLQKPKLNTWLSRSGRSGYRLLAVAKKTGISPKSSLTRLESSPGFELVGLLAFTDRLKPTAYSAVKTAGQLGVRIKILTGDSPEVAGAVASQIGLITNPDLVITGSQLQQFTPRQLARAVTDHAVFARINPLQKNLIIDTLQKEFSVGFLGEGINDAVALKSADVGLVVAGAADVARDSADIILLEKDLNIIVEGIRIGRTVTSNVGKYIVATLTSNFGNFFALAVASLLIKFLPMLPIQILLLNFLSDFPMISIATDHVPASEVSHPIRFDVRRLIMAAVILGAISTLDDFAFFALFHRISPGVLRTNWFIGSTLTELALLFSIRTPGFFFRGVTPSRPLLYLSITAAATALVLPFTPLSSTFSFVPPTLPHLLLIFALVAAYFLATELAKLTLFGNPGRSVS